jgi:hypothetical protein
VPRRRLEAAREMEEDRAPVIRRFDRLESREQDDKLALVDMAVSQLRGVLIKMKSPPAPRPSRR